MKGSRFPFPDRPRLWGVAVSHYQVEGDDRCDWTLWEERGLTRGGACGAAVDSWRLYEQDVDLAAAAGANAFRFSVSWSRVEPRPGEFDEQALERYRRLVDYCLSRNIEPVVTLFHYTHPLWFHERTPWTSPRSVAALTRFVGRVVDAFGPTVRLYTILNEPLVFLLAGYIDAQIPPGLADPRAAGRALEHLLNAHAESAALIRARNPGAAVGIAHNMMAFAPCRRFHPLDRLLAAAAHRFYNVRIWEAFATGRWDFLVPPWSRFRGRCDALAGSLDLVGVNFYSRLHLRCPGAERWVGDFRYEDRSGLGLTDNGWEVAPAELRQLVREASALGLPVLITENGVADAGDHLRPVFIRHHTEVIEGLESEGFPIAGYFYWSLLDNYEWLDGYGPKFGLYEVDRTSMQRHPRPSVRVFNEAGERFLRRSGSMQSSTSGR